jgi:phosphoglucomutase
MHQDDALIQEAEAGISAYLDEQYRRGVIDAGLFEKARRNVVRNLADWLHDSHIDALSPNLKTGIRTAIRAQRWAVLTEVFVDEIAFGTAGIRGKAAMTDAELQQLKTEGLDAPILKGPNTLNNVVLLLKSAGVARYAADHGLSSIVIGYDSRVQGEAFARLIARLFLAGGLKVYLFDEACPYPEMTFAIPYLHADIGILISASHNDRRYNGYKLSAGTGSQFEPAVRKVIYNDYIRRMTTADIWLIPLEEAEEDPADPHSPLNPKNKLVFLGGEQKLDGVAYYDRPLINIHQPHIDHIKGFIMDPALLKAWAGRVRVGYCAFHGAGRKAVPRLLRDFGFEHVRIVTAEGLNELNGLFPAFQDDPEQQPDPGDAVAAEIAVNAFRAQYGEAEFARQDILIGTDPDADRAGLVIKVPEAQQFLFGKGHRLLDADDAWTLLLWYRLKKEAEASGGVLPDADRKFIVLSHITTDALVRLARKHGIGVVKTWVGFGMIANAVQKVWAGIPLSETEHRDLIYKTIDMAGKPRSVNIGCLEQSNGFSILGGPPPSPTALGAGGHVRDKDGAFAAILLAEVAAYAKSEGTTLFQLLDEQVYLDPDIGYFVTYYEPSPKWGEYKGLEGWTAKINILRRCVDLCRRVQDGTPLSLGGMPVRSAEVFVVGKYAEAHQWPDFPDEGIRFYFDGEGWSYLTVRPSGTSQCLRFHIQLKADGVTRANLAAKKRETNDRARAVVADIRERVDAGD